MIDENDAHTLMPELKGRSAIVTGGTTGIGRATAVLLASYGVKVFICGRTPEHLDDALQRIAEVGEGDGIAVDLSLPHDIDRFYEAAGEFLGEIDIAVINAAVPADALADAGESEARYQIETDFTAYLICAQEAARRMGAGSDIIFIGSMSAVSTPPGSSLYVARKLESKALSPPSARNSPSRTSRWGSSSPALPAPTFSIPIILLKNRRN